MQMDDGLNARSNLGKTQNQSEYPSLGEDDALYFSPSDPQFAGLFLKWREDEETKKFNPLRSVSLEGLQERLKSAKSDFEAFETAESFFWFIELNSEKVGHLSLHQINKQMLTAEIGYAIVQASRAQGIASRALRKISKEIFARTPLRKLIAFVQEDNVSSIRVLEKAGYQREGRLRDHYLIDGKPATELIYGLLKTD